MKGPPVLLEAAPWQGSIFTGGSWKPGSGGSASVTEPATGASGTGSRFGGAAANIEAFTEARWITMRGQVPAYPF
jgi:hypothetical protein